MIIKGGVMQYRNEYLKDYVVFDIETTGLKKEIESITEIAAVRVRDHKVVDEFSTLVKPFKPIPDDVVAITHITNDMVKDAPPLYKVLKDFVEFIGTDSLVGHNIHKFDIPFVKQKVDLCVKKGFFDESYSKRFDDRTYADSLAMVREQFSFASNKLGDVANEFNITVEGAHRALNDVKMNQQVYESMRREIEKDKKSSEEKISGDPTLMNFFTENAGQMSLFQEPVKEEIKAAYVPKKPEGGFVRVTSFRGVKENEYDQTIAIVRSMKTESPWINQCAHLSPSTDLFYWYLDEKKNGRWNQEKFDNEYVPRFIKEISENANAKDALDTVYALQKNDKQVALLCFCPDEKMCHRSIVAGILQGMGAKVVTDIENADYRKYYDMYQKALNKDRDDNVFFCFVTGSDEFNHYGIFKKKMDSVLRNKEKVCIVSDGSGKVDMLAKIYAGDMGYSYRKVSSIGIAMMPICKTKGCVCFWNGEDEKNCTEYCQKHNIPLRLIDYSKILEKGKEQEEIDR